MHSGIPMQPGHPPPEGQHDPADGQVYALLDNVRSVWNVGSMFRTADAARLDGLFLCGMTATPPRADMEKTALGATLTVPWDYWKNAADAVLHLRERGVGIIALEQTGASVSYADVAYRLPLCFVVGHEVNGVSDAVLELADASVEIPMAGSKQSLNVAVSFGILAYEIRRQHAAGGCGAGGAIAGPATGCGRGGRS